jgi:hypothetical protein
MKLTKTSVHFLPRPAQQLITATLLSWNLQARFSQKMRYAILPSSQGNTQLHTLLMYMDITDLE